jgi:hypothetical protein
LWLPKSIATILFWVASALLVLATAWLVWRTRAQNWRAFQFTLGFVALVTTLLAGRIGTPDQVLLFICWFAWFAAWHAQKRRVLLIATILFLLVAPWMIFLNLLEGDKEAIVVTTILPMFTLLIFFAWMGMAQGRAAAAAFQVSPSE